MKAAEGRERPALTHWPRLSAKDNKKRGGGQREKGVRGKVRMLGSTYSFVRSFVRRHIS